MGFREKTKLLLSQDCGVSQTVSKLQPVAHEHSRTEKIIINHRRHCFLCLLSEVQLLQACIVIFDDMHLQLSDYVNGVDVLCALCFVAVWYLSLNNISAIFLLRKTLGG